jgi:hypothetical protein
VAADSGPAPRLAGRRLFALSLVVPLLFLAVALATLGDYGETWDEQFDQNIGRYYWNDWSTQGVKGLERFIPLQRNYGPFFDVLDVALHELVFTKLKWITDPVASHHLAVVLMSTLTLFLVFRVGLALFGAGPALLAQVVLVLMPQFLGHAHNNLKDTPLMALFTLSLLLMVRAVRSGRWGWWALAGVATGLTYAIKIHAYFVPLVVVLWQLGEARLDAARWKKVLPGLALAGATAFGAVLAAWPYYRTQPIARFLETYRTFKDHQFNELVFYLGQHVRAHDVPWHFPFVMFGVNTPIVVLALFLLALAFLAAGARGRMAAGSLASGLLLCAIWFFLPIVAQIASGTAKLDGVRHYIVVFPAMALLAAAGAWEAGRRLGAAWGGRPRLARAWAVLVAVALLDVLRTDVHLHPYQVVFFNALAGGPAKAREKFELDYWGVSLKQAAAWMNANLPDGARVLLTGQYHHFLHVDPARFRFAPDLKRRPNLKVSLIRGITLTGDPEGGDYLHPSKKPVYAVTVDGANLVEIFAFPENADLADGTELEPSAAAPRAGAAPGLGAQVYADADFRTPEGGPRVYEKASFPCAGNPWNDRAVTIRYEGSLRVPADGTYAFEVFSDDDAVLFLNGRVAVANDSTRTTRRRFRLKKGVYDVRLDYRNDVGAACLRAAWGPDGPHEKIEELGAPAVTH